MIKIEYTKPIIENVGIEEFKQLLKKIYDDEKSTTISFPEINPDYSIDITFSEDLIGTGKASTYMSLPYGDYLRNERDLSSMYFIINASEDELFNNN